MREIKFRAWLTNGEGITYSNGDHMEYDITVQNGKYADVEYGWDIHGLYDYPIMQYTGLKDKNGVEIFEGDIVRAGFDGALAGTIVFGMYKPVMNTDEWEGHQSFYIEWHDWDGMTRGELGYWLQKNMETQAYVIGNIYETPELLKEVK